MVGHGLEAQVLVVIFAYVLPDLADIQPPALPQAPGGLVRGLAEPFADAVQDAVHVVPAAEHVAELAAALQAVLLHEALQHGDERVIAVYRLRQAGVAAYPGLEGGKPLLYHLLVGASQQLAQLILEGAEAHQPGFALEYGLPF